MSDWWDVPYMSGGPAKPKGFPRSLYPPDAAPGHRPSVKGPDVIAYKRTLCKLGRWGKWDPDSWDERFSNAFAHGKGTGMVADSGIAGFQRQMGIRQSGFVGPKTFNALRYALVPDGPHKGEQAMDSVAVQLLNEAYDFFRTPPPPDTTIQTIKYVLADYLRRSIAHEPDLHYSKNRPMTHLGDAPENGFTCDCSGHSTGAYFWAQKVLGVTVPDPNRYAVGFGGYNGYGWTGSLIAAPKLTTEKYEIGDLAIYGGSPNWTTHVVTCMRPGDRLTSVWCSMGSEAAPYSVRLTYRADLVSVVRPGLTA